MQMSSRENTALPWQPLSEPSINKLKPYLHLSLVALSWFHNEGALSTLSWQPLSEPSINEIALKCREPLPAHMQINTCAYLISM